VESHWAKLSRYAQRACLTVAVGCSAAPCLQAQVITGRLLDAQTDAPIPVARLVVLDSALAPLSSDLTDLRGRFEIRLDVHESQVMIYASALAYRSFLDGPFQFGPTDTLEIEFRIEPHPMPVDSVLVRVEGRQRRLDLSGFYQRRDIEPGGVFLELPDLEAKRASRTSDFFTRIPGVRVVPQGGGMGRTRVLLRNGCLPTLFIDGFRVRTPEERVGIIDDFVHRDEVAGIEIYRSAAQVPVQYGGTGSGCGVILIWTH